MNAAITNPINLILVILGTYLGIKLSVFLLNKPSTKSSENKYLGLLVLTQALPIFIGTAYRFDLLPYFQHFLGFHTLWQFLLGPLAYFYVRACTQQDFSFRPILWLHFLPFLLELVYTIPFFMMPGSEKLALYEAFVQSGKLYSPPALNLIKSVHGLVYFGLAIHLIQQYRKHLPNAASSIDKGFHRWLLFFIFMVAFPIIVSIIFALAQYSRAYTILTWLCGVLTFFMAIDLAILLKPALFQTFPHQMLQPESFEEQKQKYESSNLQNFQKDKYIEKLQTYVKVDKPFLASELTLAQLSEQVNIPAHHLSQVINEKLDCNFLDFINGYRVEEAKEKLTNPKLSHYTIMATAYESGFNAKSTFYSVFKKHTGMTPSQYRKQTKIVA